MPKKKHHSRYVVFAFLIVFLFCPCVGWFDYWVCSSKGWESTQQWDAYTYNYGWLILVGFGVPICYAFASDPIAGSADGYFALLVIVTALICTISDFWFWILRGIYEKIPIDQWFPPQNEFPSILPWRLFNITLTTNMHLILVAIGFILIFGGAYAFTKKYV